MKKIGQYLCLLLLPLVLSVSLAAKSSQSWGQYLREIKQEARNQGIRQEIINEAFKGLKKPSSKVLRLDNNQPEKRLTFLKYRNTRADNYRIVVGRREFKKYKKLLNKIGRKYNVSPCFIVSLWGLESSYGRFMGSFPVIHSLATLGYNTRRADFFRKELFHALHILNGDHINIADFKGEWAGASGQSQFLPSSWHNYAVDHDGDGKKDIWTQHGDIFASIANYLKSHGWQGDQPWAVPVTLPAGFNEKLLGREIIKSVRAWRSLGVVAAPSYTLPRNNIDASIVKPYGGPDFMVFNNFNVIMKWNRSIYYAGTVGYMAEKVCNKRL